MNNFCKAQKRILGCSRCIFEPACTKQQKRKALEDYPNIDEEMLKTAANDIREINGQEEKQNHI